MKKYYVNYCQEMPPLTNEWEGDYWKSVPNIISIDNFHFLSKSQHPLVYAKLCRSANGLDIIFNVEDDYMICKNTQYNSMVCQDSCVEFFVKPCNAKGYFNFEVNCGGCLHCSYIINNQRMDDGGFKDYQMVLPEHGKTIKTQTSTPGTILQEVHGKKIWTVSFFIPWDIFSYYCPEFCEPDSGTIWRGNFYKCADESSRAHWASWNAIGEELNFHQPKYFGELVFE